MNLRFSRKEKYNRRTYAESTSSGALILLLGAILTNPVSKVGSPATAEARTDVYSRCEPPEAALSYIPMLLKKFGSVSVSVYEPLSCFRLLLGTVG
jgi:hypothetical protein